MDEHEASQAMSGLQPLLVGNGLNDLLRDLYGSQQSQSIVVGVFAGNRSAYAAVGKNRSPDVPPESLRFEPGCITKLFTDSLVSQAASAGRLDMDAECSSYLRTSNSSSALSGITLRHLMEHTHGIDCPAITRMPFQANGHIDSQQLLEAFGTYPKLARPGAIYSYSHIGGWILGAVLERCYGAPYRQVLEKRLFEPLGMQINRKDALSATGAMYLCPASGGDLQISVRDMLEFLKSNLANDHKTVFSVSEAIAISQVRPLGGWTTFERGIRGGWKYYSGGWFGHDATIRGGTTFVRVQPYAGVGIAISAIGTVAATVASKVFCNVLPEFSELRMPRMLTLEEEKAQDLEKYVGVYDCAVTRLAINTFGENLLNIVASKNAGALNTAVPPLAAVLRPAHENIFFPRPNFPRFMPIIQFIADEDGVFRFIWNGSRIWSRR